MYGPTLPRGDAGQAAPAGAARLLIASRVLGANGQPWLWRQVMDLGAFRDKHLLCWQRRTAAGDPLDRFPVHIMAHDPAPYDGDGRWWYRLQNLPARNFYAARGREASELAALLRRERPGVILCYFGDIAMRLLPVARDAGIPVVAYLHGDFLFASNRWYRWSLRRCLCDFAAVVVVTDEERCWMAHNGVPAERLHVVPCGAPTAFFRPAPAKPGGPVRFVMVGRLIGEKGCDLAIEAFARLLPEMADAELHIYGDGPARGELQAMVTHLGLQARVAFHGYVDEHSLAGSLAAYDVFIQHSLVKEGSPVAIAEAMACGLAVVATPVGGIVDQVIEGETGLLVAQRDVPGMAAAMRRLAGDLELRLGFGRAARARAIELYDASRQTRRLEKLLLEVAGVSMDTVC